MEFNVTNDWNVVLDKETKSSSFEKLKIFVDREYNIFNILPKKEDIFNAYNLTAYKDVKVVIIGQDPYHTINKACGLAFSVPVQEQVPPTLNNIYKELHNDIGTYIPNHGNLEKWAKQGIFLINNILTVREGSANSHKNAGWEVFTNKTIMALNKKDTPIVFILWGNNAKSKEQLITNPIHTVLHSFHPSPLSAERGFFGCKHFSKTNDFLEKNNMTTIDWQIENI